MVIAWSAWCTASQHAFEHSFPHPRGRAFTNIAIGLPVAMPNGPLATCLGSYPSADLIVRAFQPDSIDPHSVHIPSDRDVTLFGETYGCAVTRCTVFKLRGTLGKHGALFFYKNWVCGGDLCGDIRATSRWKKSPDRCKEREPIALFMNSIP